MQLARYVVDGVVVEGRSMREAARSCGVSKSWVSVLVARYRQGGYEALEPRSKRPHRVSGRTPDAVEDEIVRLRKWLSEEGLDAGPETIAWHLARRKVAVPSISTIWRILVRRGFVTPEPKKRPRASYVTFCAALPNECWQSDVTHWTLADGTEVEILNFEDDHSRVCIASRVRRTVNGHDVVDVFVDAAATWGYPASVLTDNGAIYNAASRKGTTLFEVELERLGIVYKHSRPYHPQNLRQGRALPPDLEEVPGQTEAGLEHAGSPATGRPLRHPLQHRAAAPGHQPAHPHGRLWGPGQGPARSAPRHHPLPGPHRQGGQGRQGDAALRLEIRAHRGGTALSWHPDPALRG